MSKRDRTTLKSFFRNGALPAAEHYRDLIDSSVNQVEDGFDKTDKEGLKLHSVGSSLRVMSLYQGLGEPKPSWVFEHGGKNEGALHIRPGAGKKEHSDPANKRTGTAQDGISIDSDGRVGVGQEKPDWLFDVNGVSRMRGRVGVASENIPHILANGKWQAVTQPMTGCQAFEIVAGAGGQEGEGRYSMVYAIAMNAFNPGNWFMNWFFRRRSIRTQTAMYGSFADRIRLRWVRDDKQPKYFFLQMCTNADFGDGAIIQYHMTRLWFDSVMSASRPGGTGRDPDLL